MIWKELRENARWAALAFFCLLIAEVFALSSGRAEIGYDWNGFTLCSNTFLLVSALGCAAIGAALGALQILPELRRDQWASLLHRPVPRHVIFLGKVAAGLLLYALATGLPLLVSTLYVACPGQFAAPFVPGLALPAVSDVLLGAVFYFAAFLLGLHPGRWFGARGAIALGAVAVLTLHLEGGWPFALPLLAAATLCAAAWGAMLGSIGMRPWMSRMALAVVLLAGVQTGLLLIGVALRGLSNQTPALFDFYPNFEIASDGEVFLWKREDEGKLTLVDMQGKEVTDPRYVGNDSVNNTLHPESLAGRELFRIREFFSVASRSSRKYATVVAGNFEGAELWYCLAGARSHFVGYDRLSARCIGICDADGFKGADAIPRPFASEPQGELIQSDPFLYWVGPQLFAFDFTERRMTPILNAGGDTIYGAIRFPRALDHSRIAVALASEIRILDADGTPLLTLPYGHSPDLWPNVGITATADFSRMFLEYATSYFAPKDRDAAIHLDVIDAQGRRVATHTPPQRRVRTLPPAWGARIAGLTNMPIPSLLATLWDRSHALNPMRFLRHVPNDLKNGDLAALFGLAVVLSVSALVWARKPVERGRDRIEDRMIERVALGWV